MKIVAIILFGISAAVQAGAAIVPLSSQNAYCVNTVQQRTSVRKAIRLNTADHKRCSTFQRLAQIESDAESIHRAEYGRPLQASAGEAYKCTKCGMVFSGCVGAYLHPCEL